VSRHAAMEAGEAGADFIAFGAADRGVTPALLEVLDWWQGLFVLPVLAFAAIEAERDLEDLRAAGADFLAVPWSLLERSGDPAAAMRRLHAALQPI
jgi:thiamine-phosphate pyrophosphorylase